MIKSKSIGLADQPASLNRRKFLGYAGAASGIIVVASSCNKDDDMDTGNSTGIDLGSGDTGILNYAYALEQLEAAFYTQVAMPNTSIGVRLLSSPFVSITVESAKLPLLIRSRI